MWSCCGWGWGRRLKSKAQLCPPLPISVLGTPRSSIQAWVTQWDLIFKNKITSIVSSFEPFPNSEILYMARKQTVAVALGWETHLGLVPRPWSHTWLLCRSRGTHWDPCLLFPAWWCRSPCAWFWFSPAGSISSLQWHLSSGIWRREKGSETDVGEAASSSVCQHGAYCQWEVWGKFMLNLAIWTASCYVLYWNLCDFPSSTSCSKDGPCYFNH